MQNTLTGKITAQNRAECVRLAHRIAHTYFGHQNVQVIITSAAPLDADITLAGDLVGVTFEADFTATEVTP